MKKINLTPRHFLTVPVLLSLIFSLIGCEALYQAQQRRQERTRRQLEQNSVSRDSTTDGKQSPLIGKPAPDFTLRDLNGNRVSLSGFSGQPVILNFWATWCGPCRVEIPYMDALYKKYKDQGLVVIGVNSETDHMTVKNFAEAQISYIVLLDGHAPSQAYRVKGIPCTYYVDKAGIVRHRDVGFGPGGERSIEGKIKELLADSRY